MPILFQVLENAKKRSLCHKRRNNPKLILNTKTAVATQDIWMITQFHRCDLFPNVYDIGSRVFEGEDFNGHYPVVQFASSFVHLCKCTLHL